MDIVLAFSALCILLVVGKILRVTIRLFQKLYLPASVIGGLLGLALVQTIGGFLPEATATLCFERSGAATVASHFPGKNAFWASWRRTRRTRRC